MNGTANPAPGFQKHPDRKITLEPLGQNVTVSIDGIELAVSEHAVVMHEGDYSPVVYIPPTDILYDRLARSDTRTYCPYKGHASYWRVKGGSNADVMWAYETPYDEMLAIKGHGAFYGNRVDISVG